MEQEGLVNSTRVRQDNRPDRRLLRLTPRGRSVARTWLEGEGSTEDAVVRLAVARVAMPSEFDRIAAAQASDLSARLRHLRELRRGSSAGFQPEALDLEIARAQADLRWLALVRDRSAEILDRPRLRKRQGNAASERAG